MDVDPRLNEINDCLYRVAIRALIIRDGKVLLVQEASREWWAFPGGGIGHGETIESALTRELEEELGLPATAVTSDFQIAHFNIGNIVHGVPRMNLFYRVNIRQELLEKTSEIAKYAWFDKQEFLKLGLPPSYGEAALVNIIF